MIKRINAFISNLSLRPKLMLAFLITVSLPVLFAAIFSLSYFSDIAIRNAKANLLDKLHVAGLLYEKKEKELQSLGQSIASNNLVILNLELLLYPPITDYLRGLRENTSIDFLSVLDTHGKLIISSNKEYFIKPESPLLDIMTMRSITTDGPQTFSLEIDSSEFLSIEGISSKSIHMKRNYWDLSFLVLCWRGRPT